MLNVDALLESLNHDLLQVGTWVNVVGHVRNRQESNMKSRKRASDLSVPEPTRVDATTIWSAGAIVLEKYNAAVLEYQKPLDRRDET